MMRTTLTRKNNLLFLISASLCIALLSNQYQARAQTWDEEDEQAQLAARQCQDRYHLNANFLANPDESLLIAAVIGWCRNNHRRVIWDERYAHAARTWSELLLDTQRENTTSISQDRLRFELQKRGVTDANVLPYSSVGAAAKVPKSMLSFLDEQVNKGRFTHFGLGVAKSHDQNRMLTTLILGRRPALIKALPVCPNPGTRLNLSLQLKRGYSYPQWIMINPKGEVQKGVLLYEAGSWTSQAPLDAGRGEYIMEILLNGPQGPEVAALFPLFAGIKRPQLPKTVLRQAPKRYRSPDEAEQALLQMVNDQRAKLRLPNLRINDKLSVLARQHAMQLLFDRHVSHRSKTTGTLYDRLKKTDLKFERALENVSLSASPEAAHERFMGSPSHRINILDPNINEVGIGVAMERSNHEDILAVCQVFIELPQAQSNTVATRKILKLINDRRYAKGRFALGLDKELSKLARQSARRLATLGDRAKPATEGKKLVNELVDKWGVEEVSVRYFRTNNPGHVLASPEVLIDVINRLGVGIAKNPYLDKPDELWIALIFAGR